MKSVYLKLLSASTVAFGLTLAPSLFAQPGLLHAVSEPNALRIVIPITTASKLNNQLSYYKNNYPARYNNRTLRVSFLFDPKVKNDYTGEELKNIIDTINSYPNILFLNNLNIKMLGVTSNLHMTPQAEAVINEINNLPLTAEAPVITFKAQTHFTAYDIVEILTKLAESPVINIIAPRLSDKTPPSTVQQNPSELTTTLKVTIVDVKALGDKVSLAQCQQLMASHTETFIDLKGTGKITISPSHFITDMNWVSRLIIPNNGAMNHIQGISHLLIHHIWETTPSVLSFYRTAMSDEIYGFFANQYCIASVHGTTTIN